MRQNTKFQMGEIVKIDQQGFAKVIDIYVGCNGPEYEVEIASDGSEDWVLERLLKKVKHEEI